MLAAEIINRKAAIRNLSRQNTPFYNKKRIKTSNITSLTQKKVTYCLLKAFKTTVGRRKMSRPQ